MDRLFSLGMDTDTCKRVLSQIKEFMQESDWHEYERKNVDNAEAKNIR